MKVFNYPNLVVPQCTVFPSVGETVSYGVQKTQPYAAAIRGMTKIDRRNWFKQPGNEWTCISLVEGVNPKLRVNKENPPLLIHGFAADYDMIGKSLTCGDVREIAARCAYPPCAGGTSLSGDGFHALWLFEEPIPVLGDYAYASKIMQICASKLRVSNFLQGFDEAFKKPDRLLSIDSLNFGWLTEREEAQVVDKVSTRLWASDVTADFNFEGEKLDLEKIKEHVDRLFPGRWNGPFSVGTRGPRFWDASATDPTAAVVTETGMVYFSDGGGFKSWPSILGNDVVSKITAESIQTLTENWYFDSTNGDYVLHEKNTDRYLLKNRTQFFDRMELCGLDDPHDIKQALVYIEDHKRVEGVVKLANQKKGLIVQSGLTYLNATTTHHIKPQKKSFEWTLGLMRKMWGEEDNQYHSVMAWVQDSLRSMYTLRSSYAQSAFIAGETNCGKSLFQFRYLTPMFGGSDGNPMPHLLGTSGFNSELGDAGHWAVSDQEGAKNATQRAEFTQKLKAAAANPSMTIHQKYCTPVTLFLNSRITFTFNLTPECLSILPRLGHETLDKVMLWLCRSHNYFEGLYNSDIEAIVDDELPGFIHWLLEEYEPPSDVLNTGGRYKVKTFHHEELLKHAKASQDNAELISYLHLAFEQSEMLKTEYVAMGREAEFSAGHWKKLLSDILGHTLEMSPNKIGAHFQALAKQYPESIKSKFDERKRVYVYSVEYLKFLGKKENEHNTIAA